MRGARRQRLLGRRFDRGLRGFSPKRRRAASSARSRDRFLGLAAGVFLGLAALGLLALAAEALGLGGAAGGGLLGGAALLGLVDLGVGKRAGAGVESRRSESWRSTRPARGRRRRGSTGWRGGAGCAPAARPGRGAARAARRSGLWLSPGSATRRFLRSTCTVLVRPCEKLCRTVSRSTFARFSAKRLLGGYADRLVPGVSRFRHAFPTVLRTSSRGSVDRRSMPPAPTSSPRKCGKGLDAREHIFARRPGEQCSMYHICPPECQIQLLAGQDIGRPRSPVRAVAPAGCGGELCDPVVGRLGGMDQRRSPCPSASAVSTLPKPATTAAGLAGERQGADRGRAQQHRRPVGESPGSTFTSARRSRGRKASASRRSRRCPLAPSPRRRGRAAGDAGRRRPTPSGADDEADQRGRPAASRG